MNAEFNWWLLIVGLATGAGVAWLVLADLARREEDLTEQERAAEVEVIAEALATDGWPTAPETIDRVLGLHRRYVAAPPPAGDTRDGSDRADEGPGGGPEKPDATHDEDDAGEAAQAALEDEAGDRAPEDEAARH